ncbi:hypothetical protein BDV96DRAFT_594698 [Lophiotrema nucula]|uniref:Stress response RCI peptide n=1 Tax=Lophiotrema nucula TaxID=690887 RepID=A0A6A5ZQT0_9PLEO|nr:hypothetical protein BDV96DRAFT_594698 [Lophiotrema nucula]
MCGADCFLFLLAVLFPPIAVWVKRGICSADSLINLALCCLGFLPGLLHAWYIILQYPDQSDYYAPDGERGEGDGSVTYYYVARGPAPRHGTQQGQQSYGAIGNEPSNGAFPGQQQSGTVNAFKQPERQQQVVYKQQGVPGQEVGAGSSANAEGSQPAGPPPTYAEVIKGDHKVQDQGQ